MHQAPGGGAAEDLTGSPEGRDLAISAATGPQAAPSGDADGSGDAGEAARRRRYGRRRGTPPPGDWFVARLGPAGAEPFAQIDDPPLESEPPRPSPDRLIEDLRFVAVDCETTGQTPHRLVEVGAVAFTVRGHVASFETLVHCGDRINPYARRLHGITQELLAGAPRPDAVMARLRSFIAGTVLVEHSADAFDTRLLGRTLGAPLDCDNLDTSRLAGTLWGLRDTIGLERLCAELGVTHRGPHTALGDAEATAACFLELVRRGRLQFGWRTLGDLIANGQPSPPRVPATYADRRRPRTPAPASAPAAEAEAATQPSEGDEGHRRRRRRGGRRRRRSGDAGAADGAAATTAEPAG